MSGWLKNIFGKEEYPEMSTDTYNKLSKKLGKGLLMTYLKM